ncbi:cuticle protein AM1159-like [Penaeus indicus]|uniref:cuticle protein AM1159-like n=1 Tax=Penaeus indicus TaxID=29960 RepID=UPI00300CADE8
MAAVAGAPQFTRPNFPDRPFVAILRDDRQDLGDGAFSYGFEAANGIGESRVGYPGSKRQTNMQGFYKFLLDDGTFAEVRFVADEFGFRAESPLLPIPSPPTPSSRFASPRSSDVAEFSSEEIVQVVRSINRSRKF